MSISLLTRMMKERRKVVSCWMNESNGSQVRRGCHPEKTLSCRALTHSTLLPCSLRWSSLSAHSLPCLLIEDLRLQAPEARQLRDNHVHHGRTWENWGNFVVIVLCICKSIKRGEEEVPATYGQVSGDTSKAQMIVSIDETSLINTALDKSVSAVNAGDNKCWWSSWG